MRQRTAFLIHGPTNADVSVVTSVVLNGKSELELPRLVKRLMSKLLDSRSVLLKEYGYADEVLDGDGYTITTGLGLAFSNEFHQPRIEDKAFRALVHRAVKAAIERVKRGAPV